MSDLKSFLSEEFSEAERAEIQQLADELIHGNGPSIATRGAGSFTESRG